MTARAGCTWRRGTKFLDVMTTHIPVTASKELGTGFKNMDQFLIAQSLLAEVFYCLVPSTDGVLPGCVLLSKAQLAQPCYSTEFLRDLLGSIIAQSLLAEVFYCLVPSTDGVLPGRFFLSKAQLA